MKLRWNGQVYDTMVAIAEIGYHVRGGKNEHLLGRAPVSGAGRADARLAVDAAGEIYIYTESDGTIRAVTGGSGN